MGAPAGLTGSIWAVAVALAPAQLRTLSSGHPTPAPHSDAPRHWILLLQFLCLSFSSVKEEPSGWQLLDLSSCWCQLHLPSAWFPPTQRGIQLPRVLSIPTGTPLHWLQPLPIPGGLWAGKHQAGLPHEGKLISNQHPRAGRMGASPPKYGCWEERRTPPPSPSPSPGQA